MIASGKRMEYEQKRKEQNAEARRGLFMLLLALIWGVIKLIFSLINEASNKFGSIK